MAEFLKTCKICGKQFIAPQRKVDICYGEHTLKCIVCDKEFPISRKKLLDKEHRVTCSKECESELRKRTNNIKYGGNAPASNKKIQNKIAKTNLKRYGGIAPMCNNTIKEKVKSTNLERYGTEYYTQTDEYKERYRQTSLKHYGVDHPFKSKEIQEKRKSTNLKRYGVENLFEKEYQHKYILPKYEKQTGYKHPSSNPKTKINRKKTFEEKYDGIGLASPTIAKHAKETNIKKYGYDNPVKNIEILQKIENTCLEKYGNRCYLQSDDGRKITEEKMLDKYGVSDYFQSKEFRLNSIKNPSKIDNFEKFSKNPRKYITENYKENLPTLKELAEDVGVSTDTIGSKVHEFECEDRIAYVFSYMEKEVYDSLMEINPDLNIERNTKKIITPYELDLYLPDFKLGIECNPTVTHNSTINGLYKNKEPKDYKYHQMKTDLCEEKGIFLLHIFGFDWTHHKYNIISILRSIIEKFEQTLDMNQCNIKEVSDTESSRFLDENHLQGNSKSDIRLGLYHNNRLVSLMTFVKNKTNCYVLNKFCNKLNTDVIDAHKILFKYFLEKYNPSKIYAVSNRAHESKKIFKELGFKEIGRTEPNYLWINYKTDITFVGIEKDKNSMEEDGYVLVYDSGNIEWKFVNR